MLIGIDASRAVTSKRTGTEAYAYFLIRSLISPDRWAQLPAAPLLQPTPPGMIFSRNLPHVEQMCHSFARLWTQVRLANELSQRTPDVFFTPAHVIPFTYRGRSVATVHDLGYHYFPEAHTRRQLAYLKLSTRSKRPYRPQNYC